MSEIETIHDQVGSKLAHLNQMISALPGDDTKSDSYADDPLHDESPTHWEPIDVAADVLALTHETGSDQAIILPAPRVSEAIAPMPQPISLQTFAAQILVGDLETASRSLEILFGCRRELAIRCSHRFHDKYRQDPSVLIRVQRLRQAITGDNPSLPLLLLQECFELHANDAEAVLGELKQRYSR